MKHLFYILLIGFSFIACKQGNVNSISNGDSNDTTNFTIEIKREDKVWKTIAGKGEPALSVSKFLKFYLENDSLNYYQSRFAFPFPDSLGRILDADSSKPYRISFHFTEKYLASLKGSGYISDELINYFRKRFKIIDEGWIKEPVKPIGGPDELEGDFFIPMMGSEGNKFYVKENKIKNDSGFVEVKDFNSFKLIKRNGKWQILPRE